jgi:hypothetical protein
MVQILEKSGSQYEVREVPYGREYVWRSGHIVVECNCGERFTLTASEPVCRCGVDHARLVREELESRGTVKETTCPKDECREWREEKDQYLRSEKHYRQEWLMMD